MQAPRTLHRLLSSVFAGLLLLAASASAQVDDQALFTTAVPPNVMLMVDNSGSMHHVVWHPSFDPAVSPPCNYFIDSHSYYVNTTDGDTYPNGGSGDHYFRAGTYSISGSGCTTSAREIFVDPAVEATGDRTRWSGQYLNWLYSTASTTEVAEIVASNNGTHSSCIGGGTYDLYRRSRITASKDILREVICQVNAAGEVRFGMAQFRRSESPSWDPQGGYVVVPAEDYNSGAGVPNVYTLNGISQEHGEHLNDAIDDLTGESWTPLAETLFQVYTYFMSRTASDRPPPAVSGTFPEYEYLPSHSQNGNYSSSGAPTVPDSPVQYECQKNFVVIITDGEPTKDDFSTDSNNTDQGFSSFMNLIGDYIPGDEAETPGWCCEGSMYLDDIAKFMHDKDLRPDLPAHSGQEQTMDVYTVGFTTSTFADDILKRTADAGGGQFYRSNDPQSLANDIVLAITDILLKSQAFTSATVPAGRASSDEKLYTSDFVPSAADGFWQGHLRSWTINNLAQILDSTGACALDDPECRSGDFLSGATPFWDAAVEMVNAGEGSRNLWVSHPDGSGTAPELVRFDMGFVTDVDLGVTVTDIATYDFGANPPPTTSQGLADMLVESVRGCELGTTGTGCVERTWLLGDIFHSNPLVVKHPDEFNTTLSYKSFKSNYATRDKVILAGSNGGFLEIFHAGTWDPALNSGKGAYDDGTGAEVAGFMPYSARQNAKELPRDDKSRDFYFVDGAPAAADVYLPADPATANVNNAATWTDWKTVAIAGMRQGGNHYYALDVTDPSGAASCAAAGSPNYPCYLWEFPNEMDTGTHVQFMGQTGSEPVITNVKVDDGSHAAGYSRAVAIVGGGYNVVSDPNSHVNYDVQAESGRAIMMIDIATGELLAMKKFDDSATSPTTDPSAYAYDPNDPEKSMFFAFASTPGVFDVDYDGYADVVIIGDLGGQVWKWAIGSIGEDPIVNVAYGTDQPNWPFGRYFAADSYLDSSSGNRYWKSIFFRPGLTRMSGTYWMAFGTGQRANLQWSGFSSTTADDERLYVMKNLDLFMTGNPTPTTLTESDIDGGSPGAADYTTTLGACNPPSGLGYYIRGVGDGEKFVTQTVLFAGYVISASFTPAAVVACGAAGDATLYTFSVECGEGLTVTNSATGTTTTIVKSDMGDGMPSNPQVTMDNKTGDTTVIVRMQDGAIWQPPGDFNAGAEGHGQLYWRER
ncbi:MAG: hypothetical protein CL910_13690 [Deltaproteobacteria bacterium]|nr:hypothetical protein [Deltaproteobacteria bacterium]